MKLLVAQVIKGFLEGNIDFAKVEKITSDAKYDVGDIKASIAGLRFIISSATKHDVESSTLSDELQQLGLPKEHATGLCKSYEGKLSALREEFLRQSFRRSCRLQSVDWKINPASGVDKQKSVDLRLTLFDPHHNKQEFLEFTVKESKFIVLLHELKQAQSLMQNIEL